MVQALAGTKDGCNQEERLPIEAGEEGVAAERQIIRDGPCADKLSLSWAGEVEE